MKAHTSANNPKPVIIKSMRLTPIQQYPNSGSTNFKKVMGPGFQSFKLQTISLLITCWNLWYECIAQSEYHVYFWTNWSMLVNVPIQWNHRNAESVERDCTSLEPSAPKQSGAAIYCCVKSLIQAMPADNADIFSKSPGVKECQGFFFFLNFQSTDAFSI